MAAMCRVCLCSNRRLHAITSTVCVEVWEKLTNAKFNTNDGKPLLVCYICGAQLRKSHQLMERARKAEELLAAVINNGSEQSQKAMLLVASLRHDFDYSYVIGEMCQFECKQFERNTVKEIKKENEQGNKEFDINIQEEEEGNTEKDIGNENVEVSEEGNEEENDINIKEDQGDCSNSNQKENVDVADVESGLPSGDYMLLKKILEREVRIILEKIDIGTPVTNHKSNEVPQKSKRIKLDKKIETKKCLTNAAGKNVHQHLYTHIHTGEKLYICDYCDYGCTRKYVLQRHIQHKHTKEKNFSCHICQYKFVRKHQLNIHLRKHTGEKPYKCDFCDYRCTQKHRIKGHIMYNHTKEKNFSCHICQYKCDTKNNLSIHLCKHTGKKPYKCDLCDYKCSEKGYLKSHIKYKHTKEKNFSCHICQYKGVTKSDLNKHLRKHRG